MATKQEDIYEFPKSTCERPQTNSIIAQPYSVFVNLLSIILLAYFSLESKVFIHQIPFALLIAFEVIHSFFHAVHLEKSQWIIQGIDLQKYTLHFVGYIILAVLFYDFYDFTQTLPETGFLLWLLFLIVLDIYSFFQTYFLLKIAPLILMFVSLFYYYASCFSKKSKQYLYGLIVSVAFIFLFEWIEVTFGKQLMESWSWFPFHIFVETSGLVAFYFISQLLLDLE